MTESAGHALFVYGTLREPAVRRRVLGGHREIATCPAVLLGHDRRLFPGFEYWFVVPAEADARVDGELMLGLSDDDLVILDDYEDLDAGLYVRAMVRVETADGERDAWTYRRGPAALPAAPS
jgi:gamma-glutamylcyclotransferase (GGCT)/AIG2-like uncharacterized protein YtfP